jgi:hypothetical protein
VCDREPQARTIRVAVQGRVSDEAGWLIAALVAAELARRLPDPPRA